MKIKYLAYLQAFAISHDHQYLIDQPFDDEHAIHHVVIAPYSRILQWQYVRRLLKGYPAEELLKDYLHNRYDVILITKAPASPNGYYIKDLRTYLREKGQPFDMARYQCLRIC